MADQNMLSEHFQCFLLARYSKMTNDNISKFNDTKSPKFQTQIEHNKYIKLVSNIRND